MILLLHRLCTVANHQAAQIQSLACKCSQLHLANQYGQLLPSRVFHILRTSLWLAGSLTLRPGGTISGWVCLGVCEAQNKKNSSQTSPGSAGAQHTHNTKLLECENDLFKFISRGLLGLGWPHTSPHDSANARHSIKNQSLWDSSSSGDWGQHPSQNDFWLKAPRLPSEQGLAGIYKITNAKIAGNRKGWVGADIFELLAVQAGKTWWWWWWWWRLWWSVCLSVCMSVTFLLILLGKLFWQVGKLF